MTYRFSICKPNKTDPVYPKLLKEADTYKDLNLEDCVEGYHHSLLIKKVLATMDTYMKDFSDHELYMKIDDDTFIIPNRLCEFMSSQQNYDPGLQNSYMGVFIQEPDGSFHQSKPCRDEFSSWFEPPGKFDDTFYPVAAQGGPGYILSRSMVQKIFENKIYENRMLNMEDKAVGLWVDVLKKEQGMDIKYITIPGTNGYKNINEQVISGPLEKYPYILHHHLDGLTIECLHEVAKQGDVNADIGQCYRDYTNQDPITECNDGEERWADDTRPKQLSKGADLNKASYDLAANVND